MDVLITNDLEADFLSFGDKRYFSNIIFVGTNIVPTYLKKLKIGVLKISIFLSLIAFE